jgi:hypothetical protein
MNDKRQYERIAFPSDVLVTHPGFAPVLGRTRDMSDGGVYLFVDINPGLEVGTEVGVQAQDASAEMPRVRARVVRVEAGGMALMFLRD